MTATAAPRTQRERRERTVGRLLDATIAALGEVGYARASVTEIGARAGVSQGGMFRHFATRLDLVSAAGEEVARRQLAQFARGLDALGHDATARDLLELTRAAARSGANEAWQELLTAARTDAALRERLAPTVAALYDRIAGLARSQPALAAVPGPLLDAVVFTIVHAFDGEALARVVHPRPDLDAPRLAVLEALLAAAAHPGPPVE